MPAPGQFPAGWRSGGDRSKDRRSDPRPDERVDARRLVVRGWRSVDDLSLTWPGLGRQVWEHRRELLGYLESALPGQDRRSRLWPTGDQQPRPGQPHTGRGAPDGIRHPSEGRPGQAPIGGSFSADAARHRPLRRTPLDARTLGRRGVVAHIRPRFVHHHQQRDRIARTCCQGVRARPWPSCRVGGRASSTCRVDLRARTAPRPVDGALRIRWKSQAHPRLDPGLTPRPTEVVHRGISVR